MSDTRDALEILLASLGESAQFAVAGSLLPVLPGLEVAGLGAIGTPVNAGDAQRLIEQAAQAPYGRGEETIIDTDVRRVWQIDPANFTLENPAWNTHVDAIVAEVTREFGISQQVKAELYKLLVYEPGSFFAGHRDTEKAKHMFATLVICLPTRHEGGTLIVEHDGQVKQIDFAGPEGAFQTQYAAFYADCRHEIRPVTSGYRVCLVYNLSAATRTKPEPPQNAAAITGAIGLLRQLFADQSSAPIKVAIPFLHQYSESGLDPLLLKGADRARAEVLIRAAQDLDYACHFALATQWRAGAPDETELYDRRGRSRWPPDESDNLKDRIEMEYVNDESLSLDHWLDPRGNKLDYGEIGLKESEILSASGVKGWAFHQEISEATGNEGTSMEQWYRQGALVLWPRDHTFAILAGEGQHRAIPDLERMAARATNQDDWDACRKFAAIIVAQWDAHRHAPREEAPYPGRMLRLLEQIGAANVALQFVADVLPHAFDGSEGSTLVNICEQSGWTPFGPALRGLVAAKRPIAASLGLRSAVDIRAIVKICRSLCSDGPPLSAERRAVCREIAAALADAIKECDASRSPGPMGWEDDHEPRFGASSLNYLNANPRARVIEDSVRVFAALSDEAHLDWFVKHALNNPGHYDLHQVVIPDLMAMQSWLADIPAARQAVTQLLHHCLTELRAATALPVEPPTDQARAAELGCDCQDCLALARFLRDPQAKSARFPMRKDRRQHMHQQITRHRCDCTHVTERKGSPQTLVCVKTQDSYQRRLAQYRVDRQLVAELELLEAGAAVRPVG